MPWDSMIAARGGASPDQWLTYRGTASLASSQKASWRMADPFAEESAHCARAQERRKARLPGWAVVAFEDARVLAAGQQGAQALLVDLRPVRLSGLGRGEARQQGNARQGR